MAGFDDLILNGQQALVYDGARAEVTEGATWLFQLGAVDAAGGDIDFTGVTGTCQVWDGGTLVTTIPVTLATGVITLRKEAADTDGLAAGQRTRRCTWGLYLTKTTQRAQIWAPSNSFLTIHDETGL